jgi:hypothetical protein
LKSYQEWELRKSINGKRLQGYVVSANEDLSRFADRAGNSQQFRSERQSIVKRNRRHELGNSSRDHISAPMAD